jgi:hypothetical protein
VGDHGSSRGSTSQKLMAWVRRFDTFFSQKDDVARWRIRMTLLLLALASLVGLAIIIVWYRDSQLAFEIAKSLLQIIVVVVLGTLVALLVADYNRHQSDLETVRSEKRERQEKDRDDRLRREAELDEFRKKVFERLNCAYVATKRARRLLRATAFSPPYYGAFDPKAKVQKDQYDRHLQVLNDTQLDLEVLRRDVEANSLAFTDHQGLIAALKTMDKNCLDELITEYETMRGGFGENSPMTVENLGKLQDFVKSHGRKKVDPGKKSKLFSAFYEGYKNAREAIQKDILAHTRASTNTSESQIDDNSND